MWLHWLHSYTLRKSHKTNVLAVRKCNQWCNHTLVCMVTDGGWTVASEKRWYKRRRMAHHWRHPSSLQLRLCRAVSLLYPREDWSEYSAGRNYDNIVCHNSRRARQARRISCTRLRIGRLHRGLSVYRRVRARG